MFSSIDWFASRVAWLPSKWSVPPIEKTSGPMRRLIDTVPKMPTSPGPEGTRVAWIREVGRNWIWSRPGELTEVNVRLTPFRPLREMENVPLTVPWDELRITSPWRDSPAMSKTPRVSGGEARVPSPSAATIISAGESRAGSGIDREVGLVRDGPGRPAAVEDAPLLSGRSTHRELETIVEATDVDVGAAAARVRPDPEYRPVVARQLDVVPEVRSDVRGNAAPRDRGIREAPVRSPVRPRHRPTA